MACAISSSVRFIFRFNSIFRPRPQDGGDAALLVERVPGYVQARQSGIRRLLTVEPVPSCMQSGAGQRWTVSANKR